MINWQCNINDVIRNALARSLGGERSQEPILGHLVKAFEIWFSFVAAADVATTMKREAGFQAVKLCTPAWKSIPSGRPSGCKTDVFQHENQIHWIYKGRPSRNGGSVETRLGMKSHSPWSFNKIRSPKAASGAKNIQLCNDKTLDPIHSNIAFR